MPSPEHHLEEAIRLARENVGRGGRPFGAVIARGDTVVATGVNTTGITNDPTDHAELVAIRAASAALGSPRLDGCTMYASGHPCPMCLGAMIMSGVSNVYYAYSNDDGEPFGLTTASVYAEFADLGRMQSLDMTYLPVRPENEPDLYELWRKSTGSSS